MKKLIGSLIFAMFAHTQVSAQEAPGEIADVSVYSLIAALNASSTLTDDWRECGEELCFYNVAIGVLTGVKTLAGPDLGVEFTALIPQPERLAGTPVLAIVRTNSAGAHTILDLAVGPEACLPVGEIDRYGFAGASLDWRHDYACHLFPDSVTDAHAIELRKAL
jgi:hypothetical protein